MFKTINKPDMDECNNLMEKTQEWAEKVGMTESDISEAISEVRKIKRGCEIMRNHFFQRSCLLYLQMVRQRVISRH